MYRDGYLPTYLDRQLLLDEYAYIRHLDTQAPTGIQKQM